MCTGSVPSPRESAPNHRPAPTGRGWRLTRSVALVGMPGAGKSAVGAALARRLKVPFVDSDAEIVAAANMSIAEIFERYGEAFFREKETLVLTRLLDGPPAILSTGGGAFLRARNRALIAERGLAVWLKADLDLLWSRVAHKDTRPLLRGPDPRARLAALYAERTPDYAQAGLAVESDPQVSVQAMAARVAQALAEHPGGILRRRRGDAS